MKTTLRKSALHLMSLLLTMLLFNDMIIAQTTSVPFTANGSFTPPAGVTKVTVEAWGGGGGGGGANGGNRYGGGGAGGAYVKVINVDVTPGVAINITVGGGGGGNLGANGSPGGQSIFASGVPVTANGGAGGNAAVASSTGAATAVTTGTFNGGSGSAGNTGNGGESGAGGGGAGNTGSGGNANGITGGAGGTGSTGAIGGQGAPGQTNSNTGANATALSAGGGGARNGGSNNRAGGAGFRGQVIVTYDLPPYVSISSGNWNSASTWDLNAVPPAGSTVIITNGHTVTADINTPTLNNLTVNGTLVLGTNTTNGTGTFTLASTGILRVGGASNFPSGYTTTTLTAGNTVEYNGSVPQTVSPRTYHLLTLSGSSAKTLTGVSTINNNLVMSGTASATTATGMTVGGNLSLSDGNTLNIATAINVTGTTTVGTGTGGTLNITSTTGAKIFTGQVIINSGGTWNNSGNSAITINGGLNNSGTFTAGSGALTITGAISNTGLFSTSSTSATPVPSGVNWGGSFVYAATSGNQNVQGGTTTYTNLSFLNSNGTNPVTGNLSVSGSFTTTAGGTLDLSTNELNGALTTISHNGTINTANTGPTPLPSGITWGGTVNYNASGGGQSIVTGTYNNLSVSNTSGTSTATGEVTVNGTFANSSAGGTFDLDVHALTGSLTSVNNTGTIITKNTSATPLPSGKTWGGTVNYSGASLQTIAGGTYASLVLSNTAGATANGPLTVNTALSLSGKLTIGNNDLTLGFSNAIASASSSAYIVTDGTGQLKRTVGSSSITFPVGNSAYNPITFSNTGTSDIYGIRVEDGTVPNAANASLTVNRIWRVTEAVPGNSQLVVSAAVYNDLETTADFSSGTTLIGLYNGSLWEKVNALYSGGTAPFTFSSSLALTPVNLSSGSQYFAIGKDYGFVAAPAKFAITTVVPNPAISGAAFDVTVTTLNNADELSNVANATSFILTTNGNAGTIGGTVTGIIAAGQNSVTVTGVILSALGTGATITATLDAGDPVNIAGISAPFNVIASSGSDIVASGNEAASIPYITHTGSINNTSDGFKVWSFTIRDGSGSADADNLPTILNDLTITKGGSNAVLSWANTINHAALFDGTTKVADITVSGESLVFTAINGGSGVSVPDNGTKVLDLYLSLKTTNIIDQNQFQFEISGANAFAANTGSLFNASFASTSSSLSGNANSLQVTATHLAFGATTLPDVMVGEALPVAIRGVDINGNLDINYVGVVTLTTTGTFLINPQTATAVNGIATLNPAFANSAIGITVTGTDASLGANTGASDAFDVTGFSSLPTDKFRAIAEGNWSDLSIWQQSHDGLNWVPAIVIPDAGNSSAIDITFNGSGIGVVTLDSDRSIDQASISFNGALLKVPGFVTLTVLEGTGTDLAITAGQLIIEEFGNIENQGQIAGVNSLSIVVSSNANYVHNQSGGAIPAANWNAGSSPTSNLEIRNISSYPSGMASTFGNVTFSSATGAITSATNLTLTGNLSISDFGAGNSLSLTGALSVGGSVFVDGTFTAPSFTLNAGKQLIINSTGNFTTNGTISGTGTVLNLGTFNTGNTAGFNGGATTALANTISSITLDPASTVVYNAAGPQTITAFNYANLASTNAARTLAGTGTIGISGVFTPGNGAYTATGSTVEFNGSGSQAIPVLTGSYNNLTTGNSGIKSLTGATTVAGTLTINSASILDVTPGNFGLTVTGNFVNNAGSAGFAAQAGTVTFNAGSGTQTLNAGGASFNNLTHSAAGTLQLAGTPVTVNGAFSNTAGTFDAATNAQSATITGLATIGGGTYLAGSAQQTFNGGLTVSGGTFTGSTGPVSATNVTISNGTLTAPSGSFTVSGNWSRTGGTFTAGANTVTFTSAGTQTLNANTQNFNNILHNGTGTLQLVTSNLTTSGTFINAAGTFDANTRTHTVGGLATISGGIYLASTATQAFNGGLTLAGGTFTGNTGSVTVTNLALNSGTLTAPSGTFSVSGNWTNNGATFTGGTNTVTFNGNALQTIGGSSPTPFNNITLNNTTGGVTLDINSSVNALTFSNASANANTLNVNNNIVLTATSIVAQSDLGGTRDINAVITGQGTINTVSLAVGTTGSPTIFSGAQTTTLTSSIANLNVSGNLTIFAVTGTINANNNGTFAHSTGNVTVGTTLTFTAPGGGGSTALYNMATGSQNGVLFLTGGTPVATTGNTTTFTATGTNAFVHYSGGVNQNIFTTNYSNLTLSGAGTVKSTTGNFTVSGQLNVNGPTVTLAAGATNTVGGGGNLTGTGIVRVTRTTATPDFLSQYTITNRNLSNLTVDYNATGAQTVNALPYSNLVISGARTTSNVTLANSGVIGVSGTFTPSATFTSGNYVATGSTVSFNGSSAQVIPPLGTTAYNNVTLSNLAGATINADVTINGVLDFTNGKITTGANNLVLGANANVTNAGAGKYVFGNLRRAFPTGSNITRSYDIGDANNYTPVSLTFNNISGAGSVTVHTNGGDHPQVLTSTFDASRTISRYWTVENNGLVFTTYSGTFNWVPGDVDAGVLTNFVYGSKYAGSWQNLTMGTRTGTSAQVTGLNSMSEFQFGDCSTPTFLSPTVTDATCNGGTTGAITLSLTGGVGPFTFAWTSPVPGFSDPATQDLANLKAGEYTVQVTALGGCSTTSMYTVNQPDAITASLGSTNVTCNAAGDGSISITNALGGHGTFEYSIDGGSSWHPNGNFSSLANGTYNVMVRDAEHPECTITLNGALEIIQPAVLSASFGKTDVTCNNANNGTITISGAAGGYGTYEYSIDGGSTWHTSGAFTGLANGTYNLMLRDAANANCFINLISDLLIVQPSALSADFASTDISCNGAGNGSITISNPAGGYGTYEYSIDGGSTWHANGAFTGLALGTYNVQIRDAANTNCSLTLNASLEIIEPAALSADFASTNITCNGGEDGTITISNAAGGYGTFEYSIDGGSTWHTSGAFTGLPIGTYNVQIRDAEHPTCSTILAAALEITQNAALAATRTFTNVTCFNAADGTITFANASGGSGEYEYSIDGGSTWHANGSFTGLSNGSYNLMVRDAGNPDCILNLTSDLLIIQPSALSATLASIDISCNGAGNGSITISNPAGGYGTYEYSIDGGSTWHANGAFTGLAIGTYNVQIRDAENTGCSLILDASVEITQPAALSADFASTNITCNGAGDGTITISNAAGGYGTFEYSIDGGSTWHASGAFTGLPTGTYNVQVRDAEHPTCSIVIAATLEITQHAALSATRASTDVTCHGANDGTITISDAAGGSGNYEYSIDGGSTWHANGAFTGLSNGSYTLRVRDAANPGCFITLISDLLIIQPAALTASHASTNVTCNGASDGSITISGASGGSNTFEYSIDGGTSWHSNGNFSGLSNGLYNVLVRDAANTSCVTTLEASLQISQPAELGATVLATNVSCNGVTDGTITINAPSGGSGSFEYSINGGSSWQSISSFTGLVLGTYNVQIRDAVHPACVKILNAALEITQPILLNATLASTHITCNNLVDGTISITNPVGGYGNYEYSINGGSSWENSGLYTGLANGLYNVMIRDADNEGCFVVLNSTLSIIRPDVLNATIVKTEVNCNGGASGSITVTNPTGGWGFYEFTIDGGINWDNLGNYGGLTAGSYTIVVRDASNPTCFISLPVEITEPEALTALVGSTNVDCNGSANGTISITNAAGGNGTYEYSIDGGSTWHSNGSFTGLANGLYNVQLRDAAHTECLIVLNASLEITQLTALSATFESANVTCNGAGDGAITIAGATGGSGNYEYSIDGGSSWHNSGAFSGLANGLYNIQVRDAENPGCVITLNASLAITQPNILSASLASTNISCNGSIDGTINITGAAGGYGTYEYSIDGGSSWHNSGSFSGLAQGTYNVQIRDAANTSCVTTLNASLEITQPLALSASLASTNVTCNGAGDGTIVISSATGGFGTYEYSIDGGSSWHNSGSFNGLANGSYNVQLRDAANPGCSIVLDATLEITQPTALSASFGSTNVTCNGAGDGTINIQGAAGGSGNYEYSIDGGSSWHASGNFTSLSNGTYNLRVRDANNITCFITLNASLQITQPAVLAATIAPTNVSCNGATDGTIAINAASGGSGSYEYSINGGSSWQSISSFTGLPSGIYDIRIRDAANTSCEIILNGSLQITQPLTLSAIVSSTNVTCNGAGNGTISITSPVGGNGTYEYSINGGSSWQTTGNYSSLANGTYVVMLRNASNTSCFITLNNALELTQPSPLNASVGSTDATCSGAADGTISITSPAGGNGTYQYSINGGSSWQSSGAYTNLANGTYNVLIRDAAHTECFATLNASLVINQPTAIAASVSSTNISCNGAGDGTITISGASGGSGNYEYSNNGGATWQAGNSFAALTPAVYSLRIRDAAHPTCVTVLTNISISQPAALSALATAPLVGCNGGTVLITVAANGGTPGYTYSLDGGEYLASSSIAAGAGTHTISVKDAGNCVVTTNVTISEATELTLFAVNQTNSACTSPTGTVTLVGSGGTPPYRYSFIGGGYGTSNVFNNLAAGTYLASVKDAGGCVTPIIVTIGQSAPPAAFSVTGGGSFCTGSGVPVGLASSQSGVTYQLVRNGNTLVSSQNGLNGFAIDFGFQSVSGTYTVIATNNATGCTSDMIGSVGVVAGSIPSIFTVTGGGSYCNGPGVTIELSNSQAGVSYQLIRNGSVNVGSSVTGNGLSIAFENITTAGSYTVVATNIAAGCTSNMSGSASVSAGSLPTAFSVTGGGSYCSGPGMPVGLLSSQSGVSYQLIRNGNTTVGAALTGNGFALDFGNQAISGTYTVIATNINTGCTTNMTGSASVTQGAVPNLFTVTGGGTYCNGPGLYIGLNGSETGVSYQLVRNGTTNVGAALTGDGSDLDFGIQTTGGTYTVVAKNIAVGCTSTMNGSAAIIAGSQPTAFSVTGGGSYCSGPGVQVGLSSSQSGVNYQLIRNGSIAVGPVLPGNGLAVDFGIQGTSGVYTVTATNSTTGCTNEMSGSATINSGSAPDIFSVTGGGSNCSGGVYVGLSGSQNGVAYQLVRNGSVNVGSPITGNGSVLDFGLQTVNGAYTVVANATGGCNSNMTGTANVSTGALPQAFSVTGGGAYCAGAGGEIGLSGSQSGISYQLVRDGSNNVGSPVTGSGFAISFGSHSTAGTYSVVATSISSPTCWSNMNGNATITITSSAVGGSVSGGGTICSGSNSGTLTLSGHTGSITRWEWSTDGGSTWNNIANSSATQAYNNLSLTTMFRALITGCTSVYSNTATMTVTSSAIGGSISGNASVCSGNNSGTLTLSGFTGTISRWERSTNGGSSWTNISNTGTTQSYSNLTQTTIYRALINGCGTAYSATATVTVSSSAVGGSVSGSTTVCSGSNSGTLTLSGFTGTISRWERSTNGGSSWTNISNTGTSQSYSNLTQTTVYRARITGCSSVYSSTATVSVSSPATGGSISGSTSACSGSNSGSLTLSGYSGTISRWERSTDGGANWTNISNTGTSQSYSNLTQTTIYRARITRCDVVYSSTATVTINPAAIGGTVNSSTTVCSGNNSGTLTLTGHNGNVIRWERSTNGGSSWSNISNTGTTQSYNNLSQTTRYRALVSGCPSNYSSAAIITVTNVAVGGNVSGSTTVCSGSNSGTVSLFGQSGTVIKWQRSTNGGSWTDINNTSTSLNYNNLTQSTRYRAVIGGCSTVNSGEANITVNSQSIGGSISGSTTVCSGNNSGVLNLSGHNGSVVRWEYSTNGGSTWTSVSNTGTTLNYAGLTQTRRYRAYVRNGVCSSVYSSEATVTAISSTVGGTLQGNRTFCNNNNSGTITLTGFAGYILRWEYSTNNGNNWSTLKVNGSDFTGTIYSYSGINKTTSFRVRVGGCSNVYSSVAKITIGCSGTTTITTTGGSGQQSSVAQTEVAPLKVYPNPSQNLFNLELKGNAKDIYQIRIYDALGRPVEIIKSGGGSTVKFGGGYVQGMYLVEVVKDGNKEIIKVIKN